MNSRPPLASLTLAAILLAGPLLLLGAACAEPNSTPPSASGSPVDSDEEQAVVRPATYAVRARVTRINHRASPPLLHLHHEPIDEFVGPDGEVEGMNSMEMPFPLADGVELDGVEVGDLIEIDLAIDWDAVLPARITAFRPLPPDTVLEFRQAEPRD